MSAIAGIATLTARELVTLADVESLRVIRNACRHTMTGHTGEIGHEQQRAWWEAHRHHTLHIWLFDTPEGTPVGFGLFRQIGGCWWATLGLLPEWRGQGHGTAIYRHLIAACPDDLYIDVLLSNSRSARAAERAGFRLTDWNGIMATLVARRGER